MNFKITPLQDPKDFTAIVELEDSAFGPYGTNNSAEIIKLQFKMFSEGFLVVKLGDEVIGYASSEKWSEMRDPKMKEDPRGSHHAEGTILCITTMVVREDYRKQGIGKAILESLITVARKHGCSKVIVSTPRTRTFYEQNGFEFVKSVQDGGVETAILMRQIAAISI